MFISNTTLDQRSPCNISVCLFRLDFCVKLSMGAVKYCVCKVLCVHVQLYSLIRVVALVCVKDGLFLFYTEKLWNIYVYSKQRRI